MPDRAPTAQVDRKQQILMALTEMLEEAPDTRITTARIAAAVEVSEAALYRHFPSKRTMYAALLGFAEDTLFGLIGRIPGEQVSALDQCQRLLKIYLEFCEKNPGITRLLTGRALTGGHCRCINRLSSCISDSRLSSSNICVRRRCENSAAPACQSRLQPTCLWPRRKAGCRNSAVATSSAALQRAGSINGHS